MTSKAPGRSAVGKDDKVKIERERLWERKKTRTPLATYGKVAHRGAFRRRLADPAELVGDIAVVHVAIAKLLNFPCRREQAKSQPARKVHARMDNQ